MADLKVNKINEIYKLQYGSKDVLLENPTVANYENKNEMNTKYQQIWVTDDILSTIFMPTTTSIISITPTTIINSGHIKVIISEVAKAGADTSLNYTLLNANGFSTDSGTDMFPYEMLLRNDLQPTFTTQYIKTNAFNNNETAGITFFITYINSVYFKVEVYSNDAGLIFQGTTTEIKIKKTGRKGTAQFSVKYLK